MSQKKTYITDKKQQQEALRLIEQHGGIKQAEPYIKKLSNGGPSKRTLQRLLSQTQEKTKRHGNCKLLDAEEKELINFLANELPDSVFRQNKMPIKVIQKLASNHLTAAKNFKCSKSWIKANYNSILNLKKGEKELQFEQNQLDLVMEEDLLNDTFLENNSLNISSYVSYQSEKFDQQLTQQQIYKESQVIENQLTKYFKSQEQLAQNEQKELLLSNQEDYCNIFDNQLKEQQEQQVWHQYLYEFE